MRLFIRLFSGCFFQLFPYAVLCFYPFDGYYRLTRKRTILGTVLLLISLCIFFAVSGMLIAANTPNNHFRFQMVNLVFYLCLILCFVWYLYAVKSVWQQKFFVFFYVLTCALILTSVSNCIVSYMYIYWEDPYQDNLPYYNEGHHLDWLFTAIVLPLYLLIIKKFYLPIRDRLDRKEAGFLSFLSLFLFILLSSGLSFIGSKYIYESPISLFLFAALLIAVFVIYIIIFRMLYLTHERVLLQQENIQAQHQMELRDEQYHRITETIQGTRRLRHDIKHHILMVQSLLSEGDIAKAEAYLNEYLNAVNQYSVMNLCSNPVINMIVSHYYALAKENDIDFTVRINVPRELPIQDSDISVLLGNLLENAITAASSAPEEQCHIDLNMIVAGKTLVVTVDNGFGGKLAYENGEYKSTKPNHTGFGLKSITAIAKKYNGHAEFTHEDMVFHSSVILEFFASYKSNSAANSSSA